MEGGGGGSGVSQGQQSGEWLALQGTLLSSEDYNQGLLFLGKISL